MSYYDKRRASIRGYLFRRMKKETIPLREVVEWAQRRYSITADEVRYLIEEILSHPSQRFKGRAQ